MITVTAFSRVPPFAQGLVRDLRVRWALEEAGLRYEVKLLDDGEKDGPDYRSWQPFGQVPAYEENGLKLFESGAIVLRIADRSENLLPGDPAARARAVEWLFAALNTIEPPILQLAAIDLFHPNEEWAKLRRPGAEAAVATRLDELAAALGDKAHLDGPRFTAGDLMMATVLRVLRHTGLVAARPALADWLGRCESRPAFQRALAGQMADFEPATARSIESSDRLTRPSP
jgi:glutathione S-transferase